MQHLLRVVLDEAAFLLDAPQAGCPSLAGCLFGGGSGTKREASGRTSGRRDASLAAEPPSEPTPPKKPSKQRGSLRLLGGVFG